MASNSSGEFFSCLKGKGKVINSSGDFSLRQNNKVAFNMCPTAMLHCTPKISTTIQGGRGKGGRSYFSITLKPLIHTYTFPKMAATSTRNQKSRISMSRGHGNRQSGRRAANQIKFVSGGAGVKSRYETYLIPGETLIPGEGGKRFTLVLDMPHI